VKTGGTEVWLRLEKQQVGALAEHLRSVLVDLPPQPVTAVAPSSLAVVEPAWIVGALGAAYDQTEDRLLVVAEELVETDEDDEPILDDEEGQGMLTMRLTRGQATQFVEAASELVAAGRPPCPWCSRPIDPAGHRCPRMN
jgi:uncharacterized repeat protein (TIGR03847 family)